MNIIAYLSLFVAIVGGLIYLILGNWEKPPPRRSYASLAEMGRIAYFVGLLVFVWVNSGAVLHLGHT